LDWVKGCSWKSGGCGFGFSDDWGFGIYADCRFGISGGCGFGLSGGCRFWVEGNWDGGYIFWSDIRFFGLLGGKLLSVIMSLHNRYDS
jgi:hypothetical protein